MKKNPVKWLIWLYLFLLVVEGALRKWVLPGLADPLLIIRDPVVILIYAVALAKGQFPSNGFITAIGILAAFSILAFIAGGNTNMLILAYGVRINYFHLPLIWVMGQVLTRKDVEQIGIAFLLTAIPMTLLMVAQFRSTTDAYINRGIGDGVMGQLYGADGRIRPPGLFAFITGPQLFYPLCLAFFFGELGGIRKRMPWYLLIPAGIATAVANPISISRTLMLSSGLIVVAFLATLPFSALKAKQILRLVLLLVVVCVALLQIPVFKEGTDVFMKRWDTAAVSTQGDAWGGVMDRTVNGFLNPYFYAQMAPFFGYGIGMGSNVAARLQSGQTGFLLAEEEWGKVLLELGPLIGFAFIFFRIGVVVYFGWLSWKALKEDRNTLPALIWTATALTIMQGQLAPPTVLGFAVVGGGLLLASLKKPLTAAQEKGNWRRSAPKPLIDRWQPTATPPQPGDRRPPIVPRTRST